MQTELRLPFPPTANNLFAGAGKRRVKSKHYLAWLEEAGKVLLTQKHRTNRHVAPVTVRLHFGKPDNRRRDLDNLLKPVLDLLVKQSILKDDSLVQEIICGWMTTPGAHVVINDFEEVL